MGGLLLTLAGALVVISQGEWQTLAALTFNPGDLLMLTGCLFYAVYTLGIRRRPAIGTFLMMWFISVAACLMTLPLVLIEAAAGTLQLPSDEVWLPLAYIVIVPSLLSQVFFMRGVDLIGPGARRSLCQSHPDFFGVIRRCPAERKPAAVPFDFTGARVQRDWLI